jgi:hypothetical protein
MCRFEFALDFTAGARVPEQSTHTAEKIESRKAQQRIS